MHLTPRMIENRIKELMSSPQNTLLLKDEAAFEMPLVGCTRGDDALFHVSKYENGEPGIHPVEWIEAKYGSGYPASGISVISWALPVPESIREKMRREKYHPCLEWSLNHTYGAQFNRFLATELEAYFVGNGIDAIAPIANEHIARTRIEKYGMRSNWSELMAAYICGLGTLRDPSGIITERGACVCLGSIIVATKLPRIKRPYAAGETYCLRAQGCTKCIERCPAGALTEDGLDQSGCLKYQTMHILPYAKKEFGFEGVYACGLCKTDVPCEACRPSHVE